MSGDVADRAECRCAELARSLGNIVDHRKDLSCLLIQEQVVVAEVLRAHVPMEVLCFHVEREHVGKQISKGTRYLHHRIAVKIGCRFRKVFHFSCGIAFHYPVLLLSSQFSKHLSQHGRFSAATGLMPSKPARRDTWRLASALASRSPYSGSALPKSATERSMMSSRLTCERLAAMFAINLCFSASLISR